MDKEIDIHGQGLFRRDIILEEREEKVQLFLRRSAIKAVAASIQYSADQADTEEVVRQIKRIDLPRDGSATLYMID